jgi:hypothetical protein
VVPPCGLSGPLHTNLPSPNTTQASIISTSPNPERLGDFWTHLTSSPAFSSQDAQSNLSLRLRDILLKQVPLIGAPQVLCALIPLAKVQGSPGSKSSESVLSEKWRNVDVSAIRTRGGSTIDTIYGPLLPSIFQSFGSHARDIEFMELFTAYGLYLSDFTLLSPLETELVVFMTIMCTGLRGPSLWHMRGMGRLLGARGTDESTKGMSTIKDKLRDIKVAAMSVVEWCGPEMVRRSGMESERGWVNVGDVVRELGGWGEDEFPSKGERYYMSD